MSNDNGSDGSSEIVIEFELDEDELDGDIIDMLSERLERLVKEVFDDQEKDGRLELIHILMSVSAQVALDTGMNKEDFMELSDYIFGESKEFVEEEEIDITKLN